MVVPVDGPFIIHRLRDGSRHSDIADGYLQRFTISLAERHRRELLQFLVLVIPNVMVTNDSSHLLATSRLTIFLCFHLEDSWWYPYPVVA